MLHDHAPDYLASLLRELCALPRETEWVEFKLDDAEPRAIGEYISALANAAALVGKAFAYVVWGVRDTDHTLAGTTFDPHATRVGNEELENWLSRLLEPRTDFRFCALDSITLRTSICSSSLYRRTATPSSPPSRMIA